MAIAETPMATIDTLADLLKRLGGIPLDRVLFHPPPGTATEADVIAASLLPRKRLCELIDGVLVEKAMGYRESLLAGLLLTFLNEFVLPRNLGLVSGADGMMRVFPGLVYIPDVAFASWDRFPNRRVPDDPIPDLAPDLAVEVLSKSNTAKEMVRKRRDYFAAGVRLVWIIDPRKRTMKVYTSPNRHITLDESETLDGGDVLPGYVLPLRQFFSMLDRHGDD
jgi:Uma2 family endonuclease